MLTWWKTKTPQGYQRWRRRSVREYDEADYPAFTQ
jgi:hypothetical protein